MLFSFFFFSSRRRHTRYWRDWSSDVCSSDLQPEAVLCDEPTGNLDSATSEEILKLLRSLPEPGKRSVVMVTHDAHAARFGDRIVHIRDGRVEREEWLKEKSRHPITLTV